MKAKVFKPFAWMAFLMLAISLACMNPTPTPEPTQAPPVEIPTEAPVETEAPEVTVAPVATEEIETPVSSGAVNDLDGLESAVINIEAEGTMIDPYEGLQINVGSGGTGFIIDPSGIAVTNNHVVTGAALLKVYIAGETQPRNARILGVSECSDLAVIDIEGDGYPYLEWFQGDIRAGLDVYVAGYPMSAVGDDYSLTKGIVSKPNANLDSVWASVSHVIEHTAKINPGNSGGPLVDPNARVLGVNYATVSTTDQNYSISREDAISIVERLRLGSDVDSIGVNGIAVSGELSGNYVTGIWVRSVKSGSPADKARIQAGDIITQLESQVLLDASLKDYCSVLRTHNPGDTLSVTIIRSSDLGVYTGQLNGRELEYSHGLTASGNNGGNTGSTGNVNTNATNSGEIYYSTDFDGGLDDWVYFLMSGKDDNFTYSTTSNGRLRFDITKPQTYIYFIFDIFTAGNVRIDTQAENLGRNTNNVSLICRYSNDGWYEFNVYNSGIYNILYYDNVVAKRYVTLFNGGSTLIKTGKDTNEYTAICKGDQLTLGINGVEVKTVSDRNLKDGKAGIGASSFDVLPIIIEFEDFYLSVP